MAKLGRQAALVTLLLGGLALIVPTFLSGTTRLGGYGGLSGGSGGMMGGYGCTVGSYGGTSGIGTAGTVLGLLGQLGILLLLVGGGYLLYRALVDDSGIHNRGTSDTAMDELRLAYARGEVSEEEYETRRKRLQQSGART